MDIEKGLRRSDAGGDAIVRSLGRILKLEQLSWLEIKRLIVATSHSALVRHQRAAVIIARVRLVALLFSILVPLWIVIDALFLEWPTWGFLAAARVGAGLAFAALALSLRNRKEKSSAYLALLLLLGIPAAFYLFTQGLLGAIPVSGSIAEGLAFTYAFLPFAMVAGLAIFPLTVFEGGFFAVLIVAIVAAVSVFGGPSMAWVSVIGTVWLLIVISTVAVLSCVAQLHYMIDLVERSSHDMLTGAFNRRSGEELLKRQFFLSVRHQTPFSVCFVDLDFFKRVNDDFGHEEGDGVLRRAAENMQGSIRDTDLLIRWGGEEFILVLPNTDCDGAAVAALRVRSAGLGMRPEGAPQTASMGLSEAVHDQAKRWENLVEIADQRMYAAKQQGRDRVVGCGDQVLSG